MRAIVALAALLAASYSPADPVWIRNVDYGSLHVVVRAEDDHADDTAARRFRVRWQQITGSEPTSSGEAKSGAVNVWIGQAARDQFPELFSPGRPSEEGFVIRAFRDDAGPHLVLAGGGARGTLYAEWEFLERFMGARSYGVGGFVWPNPIPEAIPPIDFRWEPPFAYRDSNFSAYVNAPWLANLNRMNGQWTALPETLGGHVGFVHGLPGYGHTFHQFVNPEEYFESHPEYFAEIDGERVQWSQLCLTNEDVLAITTARAREFLRAAAPHERILSVSQMDYPGFASWCTCAECRAVDEREGAHSGTIVRFVNAVAEALGPEFPDTLFETFAYMHSRTPPKLVRPRENVIVRVCAIEADYGRPIADRRSAANRAFVRDLRTWRRIARHVYAWDYTQNWWAFQAPHPNLHVLQPNLAFYRRVGVDGLFEQASPYSSAADFEPLKAYLIGRGLREPDFDWEPAYADFIEQYYGPAAPLVDEYQRLLRDRLEEFGGPLWFYNELNWIDADTVERAEEIFARAFDAAPEPPYADRVREAYVAVQFAALVCPPRVYRAPDDYVFTRPPSQTLEEYIGQLETRGVQFLNDYPLGTLRSRMDGETPPRYERAPIERLANADAELWVVAARSGAIVRWREAGEGRDWLRGFDDILQPSGRIQDWADTGPHPSARPYPVDQRYDVIERADDAIEVAALLDNGLFVTRRMTLTDGGMEVRVEIENTGAEPLRPKFGVGMEFSHEGQRPEIWQESAGAWTRAEWTLDGESGLQTSRAGDEIQRWGLRHRSIARSILVEPVAGAVGRRTIERTPRGDAVTLLVEMDSSPLNAGGTREMTFRIAIEKAPLRKLAVAK